MTADRRWPVITALGIEQILAWGMSYYLLTVLAKPISADTGWPLSWVVGSLSVGLLVAGTVSPRVGRLIGTYGGRPVMSVSVILLAIGLALLGWSPSLPVFVVAWIVLGAGMGAGLYDAAFATLGRLYGATARPSITTLTLWGGFASTVCWPLSAWLIDLVGWRHTCFIYAAVQLGICLPLILSLPHAPPMPPKPDGSPVADEAMTPAERRAFLLMGAIVTVGGACTAILSVHVLTFLQAKGITLAVAVAMGALIGPSQVGARILEMLTGGRYHPLWTLTVAMSLVAGGILFLWAGFPIPAIALILYGAGNGIYSIARGTVPLALFGPDRYAPLLGRLAMPSLLAQALTPSAAALILTGYGTDAALAILALMALTNVGLVVLLWQADRALRPTPSPA
jgi:predicted MFS family arabinose efflux permease